MIEKEQVIKDLYWATQADAVSFSKVFVKRVLELLLEKEAVEPKHYEPTRYNGELFACGDCKHELEKKPRFCPYCGKEVKWCD